MRVDVVGLTCRMKTVLITAMFNIGTGGAIPAVAPKGTGGGSKVTGVGPIENGRDSFRKTREAHVIHKAKTIEPLGINKRDEL